MPTILAVLLGVVVAFWLGRLALRMAFNAAVMRSPNTARRTAELEAIEVADWFGSTGLDDATERELPRYLRRELGEYLDDPNGLKASDLRYLGIQTDARGTAHFWAMPERRGEQCHAYAHLGSDHEVLSLGWGDWRAPKVD